MDPVKLESIKVDNKKLDKRKEPFHDKIYDELNDSSFSQSLKNLSNNYKKKKSYKNS
ncbi:MAG: hypothetical protein ACXVLQ_03425 [Bacteriovorax sp.]